MNRGNNTSALVEQQRQSAKASEDRTAFDYEQRARGATTSTGRIRRFGRKSSDHLLSMAAAGGISPALVIAVMQEQEGALKLREAFEMLAQTSRFIQTHMKPAETGVAAALTSAELACLPDEDLILTFGQMEVPETVAGRLQSEIDEIIAQDRIERALFNAGQYGPFLATHKRGLLMRDYMVRFDPETRQYGHDMFRVADEVERMVCDPNEGTCSLHVFHAQVRPGVDLRGIHVTQADPNAQTHLGVQAALSDRAPEFKHS